MCGVGEGKTRNVAVVLKYGGEESEENGNESRG